MMSRSTVRLIFIFIITTATSYVVVESFSYYNGRGDVVVSYRSRKNPNHQQYSYSFNYYNQRLKVFPATIIRRRSFLFQLYDRNNLDDDIDNTIVDPSGTSTKQQQEQSTLRNVVSRQDFIREGLLNEFQESTEGTNRRNFIINSVAVGLLGSVAISSAYLYQSTVYTPSGFQRLPRTQFIAALGNPNANSGTGATEWGIWTVDPGPRGIYLRDYETQLVANNNESPVFGWKFNPADWWVEEHGIIMESPKFPLQPGRYLVTGGRSVTTGLTIQTDGSWKLDGDTTKLYDVTHLPCRSGRYTPIISSTSSLTDGQQTSCIPSNANVRNFPVPPGAEMPIITGCNKQDYAVLFVVGKAI